MDSVTLRKSHFKLGDFNTSYNTSVMEMNKNIDSNKTNVPATLSKDVKDDLRRSHFKTGNFNPSFQTMSASQFTDKSREIVPADLSASKGIAKSLRQHNYQLGNFQPNYTSETGAKFQSYDPNLKKYISNQNRPSHFDPRTSTKPLQVRQRQSSLDDYGRFVVRAQIRSSQIAHEEFNQNQF